MRKERYSRVYVVYPRGLTTGGPEALHQLADMMRSLGIEAYMLPLASTEGNARPSNYDIYDAPEADDFEDKADVAVVIPETCLYEAARFSHAKVFVWWLSINNSPIFNGKCRWIDRRASLSDDKYGEVIAERARGFLRRLKYRRVLLRANHLAQSEYAQSFLRDQLHVEAVPLSDYTPPRHSTALPTREEMQTVSSNPVVAYNPAKGGSLVQRVMRTMSDPLDWMAISNMTPEEVQRTLESSHIYLDLGQHPGKDRLPREAARAGAVVIVAARGAGAFAADVPVPDELRLPADEALVNRACEAIQLVLRDLGEWRARQHAYEALIGRERDIFEDEVAGIFLTDGGL